MDRQVLGILAPDLGRSIGWSESDQGLIVAAFQTAYAIGLLGVGRAIDLIGTGAGSAIAIAAWSLAAMGHGLAGSAAAFAAARFALGLGESGNFPAAVKVVVEWFPRRERALATGLFNCGSNVGAIVAPLVVPWLALRLGWPWAFYLTGALGFLWLLPWLAWYDTPERHPRLTREELDYIRRDPEEPAAHVPWRQLLGYRETWGLVAARFVTDPVWWFYLYWAPKFLHSRFGLALDQVGPPLVAIYLAADAGAIFGGWLSSWMIRRGHSVNASRKAAILVSALMVAPIVLAPSAPRPWMAVALLGLATAGHQAWASNIFTIVSDVYPQRAVGTMIGISGFGGSVGGMLVAGATGFVLQATGSYVPIFVLAGGAYFVALGLVHVASPALEPVAVCPTGRSGRTRTV